MKESILLYAGFLRTESFLEKESCSVSNISQDPRKGRKDNFNFNRASIMSLYFTFRTLNKKIFSAKCSQLVVGTAPVKQ